MRRPQPVPDPNPSRAALTESARLLADHLAEALTRHSPDLAVALLHQIAARVGQFDLVVVAKGDPVGAIRILLREAYVRVGRLSATGDRHPVVAMVNRDLVRPAVGAEARAEGLADELLDTLVALPVEPNLRPLHVKLFALRDEVDRHLQ